MHQSTIIPLKPHMIVISYGPDSTVPGAYVLTLVILVITLVVFSKVFLQPHVLKSGVGGLNKFDIAFLFEFLI